MSHVEQWKNSFSPQKNQVGGRNGREKEVQKIEIIHVAKIENRKIENRKIENPHFHAPTNTHTLLAEKPAESTMEDNFTRKTCERASRDVT